MQFSRKKLVALQALALRLDLKVISYYWYFHGYRNTERLLWINSFLYVLAIVLLVELASYASVLIKLYNFGYLLFGLYREPGLLPTLQTLFR